MTYSAIKARAIDAGYTVPVFASSYLYDLDLLVRPETLDYLDSGFVAICLDTGDTLAVNGCLFEIEVDPVYPDVTDLLAYT